ncbi:SDR family NAD(P)-dependent oxidoreductase [Deminuibacter soli]|uniref:SDR family NAD(P)-dependent oxidoreductase n=1 Tax=Deminuibacter soli TaxID=2291815 RepID=A0A3E1NLK7_9BACT|nr:SDR family oxidoreductase [Deminuibacter soli]RFM28819.1 SDR family NAD(P)-dependent oxidoreductase [Deminuibacter soli]
MQSVKGKTAFITGASSGIGKAFAYHLAARQCHLILTARSENALHEIARDIRQQYQVQVTVYAGDLCDAAMPQQLFDKTSKDSLQVDILINNAGFGKWAHFLDETIASYEEMIALNITALVKLTHLFLPQMLTRGEGGIINIGSTGSFQPCPYIGVYCASKAFVLSFSEALYGEYFKRGIHITAVCPGNTQTPFFSRANANTKGMGFDTPEKVAKDGLSALLKGKNYTVIGFGNYLQSLSSRFFTRKMTIGIVGNIFRGKVNAMVASRVL